MYALIETPALRKVPVRHLLLVEDQSKDLIAALNVAESLGIEDINAKNSIWAARDYLEKGLQGEVSLPDAIVLDLDLGVESGFELLRMWHSTPRLAGIPLMIWSVVEDHRELCELFKVKLFVSKWQGIGAFRDALAQPVS
jgi:CheY-like chemotaxis protein